MLRRLAFMKMFDIRLAISIYCRRAIHLRDAVQFECEAKKKLCQSMASSPDIPLAFASLYPSFSRRMIPMEAARHDGTASFSFLYLQIIAIIIIIVVVNNFIEFRTFQRKTVPLAGNPHGNRKRRKKKIRLKGTHRTTKWGVRYYSKENKNGDLLTAVECLGLGILHGHTQ